MLRKLEELSSGMLLLHGHITDPGTLRRLARDASDVDRGTAGRGPRAGVSSHSRRHWRSTIERVVAGAIGGGSFSMTAVSTPRKEPRSGTQ